MAWSVFVGQLSFEMISFFDIVGEFLNIKRLLLLSVRASGAFPLSSRAAATQTSSA
jgi:hypothetical protein